MSLGQADSTSQEPGATASFIPKQCYALQRHEGDEGTLCPLIEHEKYYVWWITFP